MSTYRKGDMLLEVLDGEGVHTCPFHSCLVTDTASKAMQRKAIKMWSQGNPSGFEFFELLNKLGMIRVTKEAKRAGNRYSIRPML